ncbi:MAG: hypothetical protein P1U57_13410 [Oleibacter sp.]|nr:hypothetical protein [Thalassolituus sp.]
MDKVIGGIFGFFIGGFWGLLLILLFTEFFLNIHEDPTIGMLIGLLLIFITPVFAILGAIIGIVFVVRTGSTRGK